LEEEGLIIFIRNPEKGKVKTRLAAEVGEERALAIYQALLGHVRLVSKAFSCRRLLYYSHFVDREDEWSSRFFSKRQQRGKDLGDRMNQAFIETLKEAERAVIIGSDCPLLSTVHLQEAFSRLSEKDYVVGPAEDGGYYLLGMKEPSSFLFENMKWSTPDVCRQTLDRIRQKGKSVHILPTLSDVDYASDWEKYGWDI
jgi:rSAM/selenodomain-associated transferase 1